MCELRCWENDLGYLKKNNSFKIWIEWIFGNSGIKMIYIKSLFAIVCAVSIVTAQIPNFGRCPEYGGLNAFIAIIIFYIIISKYNRADAGLRSRKLHGQVVWGWTIFCCFWISIALRFGDLRTPGWWKSLCQQWNDQSFVSFLFE